MFSANAAAGRSACEVAGWNDAGWAQATGVISPTSTSSPSPPPRTKGCPRLWQLHGIKLTNLRNDCVFDHAKLKTDEGCAALGRVKARTCTRSLMMCTMNGASLVIKRTSSGIWVVGGAGVGGEGGWDGIQRVDVDGRATSNHITDTERRSLLEAPPRTHVNKRRGEDTAGELSAFEGGSIYGVMPRSQRDLQLGCSKAPAF